MIYPPNQAYEEAKKEMESPQKRRPQSGEASPNKKYQICIEDESELQSIMALSKISKTSKRSITKSAKPNA